MDSKELTDIGEEITKKPKQKRPKKSEQMSVHTEPGDNAKYIGVSMQLFKMPDIDLNDVEQVNNRLEEFFEIHYKADLKPTVVGMAMALGISRQTLWAIRAGQPTGGTGYVSKVPTQVTDSIKKAYNFMENLWENYMQNGKINPVSGIFLGKNNYGYRDKTEYVLTPKVNPDADYDAEDIKQRYLVGGEYDESGN